MTQGTEQQTFSCQCHPLPLSSRGNYKSLKWKVRWDTVIWILLICLFLVPFSLTWCASTTTSELVPTWSLRLAPSSAHSSLVLYRTGRWHRLRYIRHWSCIGQVNGAVSGTFVIGLVSDRLGKTTRRSTKKRYTNVRSDDNNDNYSSSSSNNPNQSIVSSVAQINKIPFSHRKA